MSGCISEWISTRALPSCSPPPPRYFSLLGTEGKFLEVIPAKRNSGSQAPAQERSKRRGRSPVFGWRSATSQSPPSPSLSRWECGRGPREEPSR